MNGRNVEEAVCSIVSSDVRYYLPTPFKGDRCNDMYVQNESVTSCMRVNEALNITRSTIYKYIKKTRKNILSLF